MLSLECEMGIDDGKKSSQLFLTGFVQIKILFIKINSIYMRAFVQSHR